MISVQQVVLTKSLLPVFFGIVLLPNICGMVLGFLLLLVTPSRSLLSLGSVLTVGLRSCTCMVFLGVSFGTFGLPKTVVFFMVLKTLVFVMRTPSKARMRLQVLVS